jgi:hypothetical protein
MIARAIAFALTVWVGRHVRQDVGAARRLGRIMIGASSLVLPLMWVALPRFLEPTWGNPVLGNVPYRPLVLIAAWIAYLAGLAWMIRIHRTSHLEPDASSWRYRDTFT